MRHTTLYARLIDGLLNLAKADYGKEEISMRAMLLCENEIIDVEDLQLSQSTLTEEALDFDE